MNVCVPLQDAEGEDLYDAEGVLLYDGDDCTESNGVPEQNIWSARIRGRTIYGTREELRRQLVEAAEEDAKKQAEKVVEKTTSKRQVRKVSRERANAAREALLAAIRPFDVGDIFKDPTSLAPLQAEYAAQAAEMNRLYLKAYEDALVAEALAIAAEDQEDMADIADILDML